MNDLSVPFFIRLAEPADVPAMAACVESAYQVYIPRMGRPPGPMLDDYSRVVLRDNVFVALAGERMAGLLVLKFDPDRALLDNVAVTPGYQGTGLGRRLIDFAEEEARKRGYACLDLYTNEVMTENLRLYNRLGYEETTRVLEKGYRRVYLQKRLADQPGEEGRR